MKPGKGSSFVPLDARTQIKRSLRSCLCSSVFICGCIAFSPTQSTAAEISLRDDLGRWVELKQPANRIVSLAPSLPELVYTAGAGDRLVAASEYSDFPPQAKELPRVS